MRIKTARMAVIALFVSGFVLPQLLDAGQDQHQHAQQELRHQHGENPLLEEMTVLDSAFREVVSAVSLGDGKRVHTALKTLHGTMEKTHAGVQSGAVRIPKNAERTAEFVRMDTEFHGDLEALAQAAHTGNQKDMLSFTKKLLDGCVSCHQTFRKP